MSKVDDSKTIKTPHGEIKWLPKQKEIYLDKTTLIFGGSGSGKTKIIEEILFLIKDDVPNFIAVADGNSKGVYTSKLPERCIKDNLTKAQLIGIWDRQSSITRCCNIANDIKWLESLYRKVADRETENKIKMYDLSYQSISYKIETSSILNFAQKKDQLAQLIETNTKFKRDFYKSCIRKKADFLKGHQLLDQEKIVLEYFDMNPKLTIILDDVSDKFQKWMGYFKRNETNPFDSIFFQGRHNNITLIFAAHDDKIVDTEFRKNARNVIFTASQTLISSMGRKGNGFSKQEIKKVEAITPIIFGTEDGSGEKKYQKFCYVREDPFPFRYTIANIYPDFLLGSEYLRRLIDNMPKKENEIYHNKFAMAVLKDKKVD
jgi:hypothetical protein